MSTRLGNNCTTTLYKQNNQIVNWKEYVDSRTGIKQRRSKRNHLYSEVVCSWTESKISGPTERQIRFTHLSPLLPFFLLINFI